ncbi:MAG: hypothetical protein ACN4EU_10520 [Brevundimonas mediterranea]
MKTTTLRLVSFGSARALTRDGMGTEFNEVKIADSLYPPAG